MAVIALAMVAALALCLVGCGGSTPSQKDIDSAKELNWTDVYYEYHFNNAAKAKQDWEDKFVKYSTKVDSIHEKYFVAEYEPDRSGGNLIGLEIFIPVEDLTKLHKGDSVVVVGKLSIGSENIYNATLVELNGKKI